MGTMEELRKKSDWGGNLKGNRRVREGIRKEIELMWILEKEEQEFVRTLNS